MTGTIDLCEHGEATYDERDDDPLLPDYVVRLTCTICGASCEYDTEANMVVGT